MDRPSLSKCECAVIVFLSGKCPSETLSIKSLQLKASVNFIISSGTSMAEKIYMKIFESYEFISLSRLFRFFI